MKKIIIGSIFVFSLVLSTVATTVSTYAVETTTTESVKTTRCTISQARLNTRITKVEAFKSKQTALYESLSEKIVTLIASAETNGYDVTALNTASTDVKAKIATYTENLTTYQTSLMATKNLSCGNSDGEYTTSLVASRAALLAVRTASIDVRATFRSEAIPAVKDYAAWIKDQTATTEAKK